MLLRYCCPRHNLLRQILSSNDYLIIRDNNEMFINNKCLLSTKFCSIENNVQKIPQKFKTSLLLNRDLIRYFSTTTTTTTTTSESNELHNFRSIR